MNKMYSMLVATALFLTNMAVNAESAEERRIREELYEKCKYNILTAVQLQEAGLTLDRVVDRDLEIMNNHKRALAIKKEDYIKNCKEAEQQPTSLAKKAYKIVTAGVCLVSTSVALFTTDLILADLKSVLPTINNYRLSEKLLYLLDDEPKLCNRITFTTGIALLAGVSGVLFVKASKIFQSYQNAKKIRKIEQRIQKDRAVIVQLKQIKNELTA
jgi:hypothetical protein